MLKNLLDMGMYLYTMVGLGILGILILTVTNAVQRKKLKDRATYQRVVRNLSTTTTVMTVLTFVVMAAAIGTGIGLGMMTNREMLHVATGLGTSILLMCYSRYLAFSDREQLLGEYLFKLAEKQEESVAEEQPQPPTKEELIERALRGIRESAASGENTFAHLLSKEEESLMREVISEFITEG